MKREAAARALSIFFGAFSILNVLGESLAPGFDATIWWLDLGRLALGEPAARGLILGSGALLLLHGLHPSRGLRKFVYQAALLFLFAVALGNGLAFYALLYTGQIHTPLPFPLSFIIAAGLAFIYAAPNTGDRLSRGELVLSGAVLGTTLAALPVGLMLLFGYTDYRRPAHAAVVFGARVYANGKMSQALYDRTRTGVDLYKRGYVRMLIFSGGPGDGNIHETQAMERFALRAGVPRRHIITDRLGLNTQATVMNTKALFRRHNLRRIIAISHFFHLPRIKMAYRRAGRDVYTVPCMESYILYQMPYLVVREVAALWVYYLKPLAGLNRAG